MEKERTMSPEEKKELEREFALENLRNESFKDMAVAYWVDNGQYGEAGNSAFEQFKYRPAIQGEGSKYIANDLLNSRKGGKRYTGNISEYGIMQNRAQIIEESLMSIKVKDVLELTGSKSDLGNDYREKWLSDLADSGDEKDKEMLQKLIGIYIQYLTDTGVSEALKERAGNIRGGLEEILNPKLTAEDVFG